MAFLTLAVKTFKLIIPKLDKTTVIFNGLIARQKAVTECSNLFVHPKYRSQKHMYNVIY